MVDAYAQLGGLEGLRGLLTDFYARVYDDAMIGFMFQPIDRATLIERETAFVARLFGARDVSYDGRSMRQAHARHRIMGGQFARRQQILRETLRDAAVPEDISARWLAHNEQLRAQITSDVGRECSGQGTAQTPEDMIDPFKGR